MADHPNKERFADFIEYLLIQDALLFPQLVERAESEAVVDKSEPPVAVEAMVQVSCANDTTKL